MTDREKSLAELKDRLRQSAGWDEFIRQTNGDSEEPVIVEIKEPE